MNLGDDGFEGTVFGCGLTLVNLIEVRVLGILILDDDAADAALGDVAVELEHLLFLV